MCSSIETLISGLDWDAMAMRNAAEHLTLGGALGAQGWLIGMPYRTIRGTVWSILHPNTRTGTLGNGPKWGTGQPPAARPASRALEALAARLGPARRIS